MYGGSQASDWYLKGKGTLGHCKIFHACKAHTQRYYIVLFCFRDHHLVICHSLLPLSGLNLAPVARLRTTWEKLPNKYEKLFQDLQDLFDPSRNMAKYRNVLSGQNLQPPVIPLFPVIKKDLTFLHEGKCRWALSVLVGTQSGHYVTSCSSSVNLRK